MTKKFLAVFAKLFLHVLLQVLALADFYAYECEKSMVRGVIVQTSSTTAGGRLL